MTVAVAQAKERIKPTGLSIENTMLLLDTEGVLVLQKSGDTVVSLGFLEPQLVLNSFASLVHFSSGILPRNCICYERVLKKDTIFHLYVFQYDPKVMNIKYSWYDEDDGDSSEYNFDLAMPYIQVYIGIKEIAGMISTDYSSITCSQKPIIGLNDNVYCLPLHNLDSGFGICWGAASVNKKTNTESIGDYARRLGTNFFTSTFNRDLAPRYPAALMGNNTTDDIYDNPSAVLNRWEKLTQENPSFILECQLTSGSYLNFGQVIQKHKNNFS